MIANMFTLERTALATLASDVVADSIKAAVVAAAMVATPAAVAAILGDASKGLVTLLLKRSTSVERKLDILLRQPLMAGLILLQQGLELDGIDPDTVDARNKRLDGAAFSFANARATVYNSRTDSLLVRCLESITMAARPGSTPLARTSLASLQVELAELTVAVQSLEASAAEALDNSQAFDSWLGRDSWRDKPNGHLEQRLWGRYVVARYARRLEARSCESRRDLTILTGLTELASHLLAEKTPA